MWPFSSSDAAAAGAREAGGELRPAVEVEPRRDLAGAGDVVRRGLPDVDGRARAPAAGRRGRPAGRPRRGPGRQAGARSCRTRSASTSARPAPRARRQPRRGCAAPASLSAMIGDCWTTSAHTTGATRPAGADVAGGALRSPRSPSRWSSRRVSPPRRASRRGRAARPASSAEAAPTRPSRRRRHRHRPRPRCRTGRSRLRPSATRCSGSRPPCRRRPGTYLGRMRAALTGDVVFGNLEGTLTDATASKCGGAPSSSCFAFRVPPEYARALRHAGFTVLSNANNHSFDFGQAGEDETVRRSTGPGSPRPASPARSRSSARRTPRIAFLGFAPYPNTASLTDLRAARTLIHRADREGRHRRVRHPRRRRGHRRAPPHRRRGDLPRRGSRQPRGLRPHGRRRRRRPGARVRAARAAGHGALPRPPDRLQPRQLRRLPQLHARRRPRRVGRPARHARGRREIPERAGSCRSGSKAPASRCPIRRARRRRSWPSSRARTSARAGSGWAPAARCARPGRAPHFQRLPAFTRSGHSCIPRPSL